MTTREQAIRDEAERSIYQDESGIYRSRFGGIGSTSFKQSSDRAAFRLTDGIAFLEAAERVRAATKPPESAEPTRLALRDAEINRLRQSIDQKDAYLEADRNELTNADREVRAAQYERDRYKEEHEVDKAEIQRLNHVRLQNDEEIRRLEAESRQLNAKVTEARNELKEIKEQHEVDKQVIEELNGVILGLREDVDDREEEIERLTKEAEAAKPQASELTKPAEKLDPFRPVTNEEFWLASGKCSTYAEAATSIIRRRVAEALVGTVPMVKYERTVRELVKGWTLAITFDAVGEQAAKYSEICRWYGVDPKGCGK